MARIDFTRDWRIVVAGEEDEVLQTAVAELQQTLAQVTGRLLPTGQHFDIPAEQADAPTFDGRCPIIGHHAFMKDVAGWIDWAARNHYNDIFL